MQAASCIRKPMQRLFNICTAAGLALALTAPAARSIETTDDRGKLIELAGPAQRVISIAPHVTELLFAIGAGASVIAADSASDYPPDAQALPRVGDASGLDLERIMALRPDLVIGWWSGNKPSDIARIERLGIPLFLSEPRHLADIPRTMRVFGQLLGTSQIAEQQAAAFERQLAQVKRLVTIDRRVTVFFEVWQQPLITVNGAHLVSDVLSACGAENIFASLRALAGPVSVEGVLGADPEVIIGAGVPADALESWQRMRSLHAVRGQQLYHIDSDLITRPTPRILQGMRQVCDWVSRARAH
jgi:iron complex transport system substrate-binding protein